MFRSPGQGDMDMMEGRSFDKCGRYFVFGVVKRWTTLSVCQIVLSIRCLRLSWMAGDCCLCREAVGLLSRRRFRVSGGCEGLASVRSCSRLLLWGRRAEC